MKKNSFILSGIAISMFCVTGSALSRGNGNGFGFGGNGFGNGFGNNYLPSPAYDFRVPNQAKIELGRNLMFDKILSGNKNISCGTCHHSLTDTGDGLSLPVGEGGVGLGVTRNVGTGLDQIVERVPRNAPPVFNLGDNSFHTMFHDGRVTTIDAADFPSGCKTPAGHDFPDNLENVLACQAMFPVTSGTEMAGQKGENSIANAAAAGNLAGPNGVWDQLAKRLQGIPAYVDMFIAAFDDISSARDITFGHAANAIAAFEGTNWRADNSPFDQYIRGDKGALSQNAQKGMKLFYLGDGKGNSCASCHSGLFQTDQEYHAIALPQIGSGRGSDSPDQTGGHEDFGREQVTGDPADTMKFRTPTLRNVALTAPYGHCGSYNSLRAIVEHHVDPEASLNAYADNYNNERQAVLPTHPVLDAENYIVMDDPDRVDYIAHYNELQPMSYSSSDIDRIIDFLNALTDPASIDLRRDQNVVTGVPSGLPVYD
ncbi:MAG: cytochrome c peroxidase [Gammaproteobacteria bacterium]|nr:cytochrome c peroxidase [Gammaproteobacteria bacterium]